MKTDIGVTFGSLGVLGAKKVPEALIDQLANNGIMVIPVGKIMFSQTLRIISKDNNGNVIKKKSLPVRFVRLVNK